MRGNRKRRTALLLALLLCCSALGVHAEEDEVFSLPVEALVTEDGEFDLLASEETDVDGVVDADALPAEDGSAALAVSAAAGLSVNLGQTYEGEITETQTSPRNATTYRSRCSTAKASRSGRQKRRGMPIPRPSISCRMTASPRGPITSASAGFMTAQRPTPSASAG